ncbi:MULTISPECIES: TonB-dependent receptor [unclassified Leeuwenhoekiella]|uniref:SusC/RagA family TonB-linked outer membrane protein n=1 Tax=unclassified Leeuwenhoekiella TaxID=2615029 RepID=UPI0025B83973|nr:MULTISPECIES: TonB-dependent receptor [unclassified Leeuwenhoekiella]|tara:strand:- start:20456 stop:23668 length:3213 start_codon:yes stop_codon:yes gene_type:complete
MKHNIFNIKQAYSLILLVLSCTLSLNTYALRLDNHEDTALQKVVTGTVYDDSDNNQPLIGVTVVEKGTNNGTATDFDGNYSIRVAPGATLVFSFVGFETKEVVVSDQESINVTLSLSSESLEETVVIAFGGKQLKESQVSSIATINPAELKGPTNNLTNMIAGRVPGMISFQRSGEPGADNSDFFIRGLSTFGSGKRNPLILIDNIESTSTDLARLQPDDIDTFSVLKDAAAASVYGARGANGVILITTKSGKAGKAKFSARAATRISTNTDNFKFADNITYMNLANEAALTRDPLAALPYSQIKIDRTATGDNPYLYPSNNWIDQILKDYTINQSFNISASGGSERARYYVSGTYNVDNGILDINPINNFNSNIKLQNYSLRSKLDIDLTPTTFATVNIYGQFDDYNGPIAGGGDIIASTVNSNPVAFPAIFPSEFYPIAEHPLFGNAPLSLSSNALYRNPYAEMVRGYRTTKNSTVQAQLLLDQKLDFITDGLKIGTMNYIRRYNTYSISRAYNPFFYQASRNPVDNSIMLRVLNDGTQSSIGTPGTEFLNLAGGGNESNSRLYNQFTLNYDKTFNEKHVVSAFLINVLQSFETTDYDNLQQSLQYRNHTFSGRFTYAFDRRYIAEFSFGYNGSERFDSSNRYGFFPSFGVSYVVSNEAFFEPIKETVTNLKLRFTYGKAGNDEIGNEDEDRFFYLSRVNANNGSFGALFGQDYNYYRPGISIDRYANPNIGWEISEQYNFGIDIGLWRDLNITAEIYRQNRSNILQRRTEIGDVIGLTANPQVNFAELESKGIDLSLDYNRQINQEWWTQARATLTLATNEVKQTNELNYPDDLSYLSQVGNNASQMYGYLAERLFTDQEEVNNSPTQFGNYSAGDIKYRDVNGDGVITPLDRVPIGLPTTPELIYGFGGTVGYKDFDLSIFFQGSARSSFQIDPGAISPFVLGSGDNLGRQNGLLKVIADSYWSEDNRDLYAFWPRLSSTEIENNVQSSSWWLQNNDFLRLKNLEFGYRASEKLTESLGLRSLRVYASGINLAVWSSFKLWDPEMGGNGLGYPIQSTYNLGVQFDF